MELILNKPENNLQLIQLEKGFIVIDLIAVIKVDDYYLKSDNTIEHCSSKEEADDLTNIPNKIIFASPELKLDNVKIIQEKDNIESRKIIASQTYALDNYINTPCLKSSQKSFMEGFDVCFDYFKKQKLYTLEQLEEAFDAGSNYQTKPYTLNVKYKDEYFESLNRQKVEITFDENNRLSTCRLI